MSRKSLWRAGLSAPLVLLSFACNGPASPAASTAVASPQDPAATGSTIDGSSELSGKRIPWWQASPTPTATATASPTPTVTASPTPAPTSTTAPSPSPSPSATPTQRSYTTAALIFNGYGTDASDAQTLVEIVTAHGLSYRVVDSAQLNNMTATDLASYGVIVWPGGDSNLQDSSLTPDTKTRIRQAVRDSGVGYAGFCAGAWIAVGPDPGTRAPIWGFAIVPGDYLKIYWPNGTQVSGGVIVPVTFPSGTVRNLVWWQGPYLPAIQNGIIGKYSDGKVAIAQAWASKGFVSITGVHPEAPQSWRYGLNDSDGLDYDVAWNMISSALNRQPNAVF